MEAMPAGPRSQASHRRGAAVDGCRRAGAHRDRDRAGRGRYRGGVPARTTGRAGVRQVGHDAAAGRARNRGTPVPAGSDGGRDGRGGDQARLSAAAAGAQASRSGRRPRRLVGATRRSPDLHLAGATAAAGRRGRGPRRLDRAGGVPLAAGAGWDRHQCRRPRPPRSGDRLSGTDARPDPRRPVRARNGAAWVSGTGPDRLPDRPRAGLVPAGQHPDHRRPMSRDRHRLRDQRPSGGFDRHLRYAGLDLLHAAIEYARSGKVPVVPATVPVPVGFRRHWIDQVWPL